MIGITRDYLDKVFRGNFLENHNTMIKEFSSIILKCVCIGYSHWLYSFTKAFVMKKACTHCCLITIILNTIRQNIAIKSFKSCIWLEDFRKNFLLFLCSVLIGVGFILRREKDWLVIMIS
uniref:Uncharacterized protein n=1 Tax=Glossina brevipalpis TaxID=37001 RepID=A0A1A9WHY7_9MUSC